MMELNWESAKQWQLQVNNTKNECEEPAWSWDCGFKLDYDGPVVRISSRFYPSGLRSEPKWEGCVHIIALRDEKIHSKEFNCDSLEQLRSEVDLYVKRLIKITEDIIKENIERFQQEQFK